MRPKFDGIKAYQCTKCAVVFGIDGQLHKLYCPACKGNTTLIGEGMMMFFPVANEVPEQKVSTIIWIMMNIHLF